LKIFGLVTKRRKLATTIGVKRTVEPTAQAATDASSQVRTVLWWG
jgi:hypothetical protein